MIRAAVIGCGAVGGSLARAIHAGGEAVVAVGDLDTGRAKRLAATLGARTLDIGSPDGWGDDFDTALLAVPDPQIEPLVQRLVGERRSSRGLVFFHCAGRLGARVLEPLARAEASIGALHPALSFAPGEVTSIPPGVSFAVEAEGRASAVADELIALLRGRRVDVPGSAREAYHAATVIAGNFPVTLLETAAGVLWRCGVEREAAEALLVELSASALRSAGLRGLRASLSGPARRGDAGAVARHVEALRDDAAALEVYRTLGRETARLLADAGEIGDDVAARLLAALDGRRDDDA